MPARAKPAAPFFIEIQYRIFLFGVDFTLYGDLPRNIMTLALPTPFQTIEEVDA